jgi:hypothetical protein
MRFQMTHVTEVLFGCVQNDFELMVHSAQTVHLSCTDANTISKCSEIRFHTTHITKVFYQVCSK